MKGKLLIIVSVIAILACIATGTAAYYTKEASATNLISTGKVDLELIEVTDDEADFPKEGILVLPGATVNNKVTVKNTGTHPIYVRIQMSKFVSNKELTEDFITNNILTTDLNNEIWIDGKDGFIYYSEVLQPGEETEPIIRHVYIDGYNTDNKYIGASFTLDIDAYGVQSENNGAEYTQAAGWPTAKCDNASAVYVPFFG